MKKLVAAILKKVGPVVVTNKELAAAKAEYKLVDEGFGTETGFKYYVK